MEYYPVPQQNQTQPPPPRKRSRTSNTKAHTPPLAPTWYGIIETTEDAIRLFEAVLSGTLMHTSRRPHDRERDGLIRSGNIFIFEECSSGIKRWTDGRNWSPSRIQGNFLIYRELGDDLPPGEKKKAIKRKREGVSEPLDGQAGAANHGQTDAANQVDALTRALVGSLVDSYNFKQGGLMKKTISVDFQGTLHHLVSYYSLEDGYNRRLPSPSRDPWLSSLLPRLALMINQDFRNEMEQENPALFQAASVADMTPTPSYGYAPQPQVPMPNNMAMQPYNTTPQFPMTPTPMSQPPIVNGSHLMGHSAQVTGGPMTWGMQNAQPMHQPYQLSYHHQSVMPPQQQVSHVDYSGYGMEFDMQ